MLKFKYIIKKKPLIAEEPNSNKKVKRVELILLPKINSIYSFKKQ